MKAKNDGKTEEIGRRREECFTDLKSGGLGAIPEQSEVYGAEQIRISGKNWEGRNTTRTSTSTRKSSIGKVIQRIELIESSYINYVREYRGILEVRLEEIKLHESQLVKAVSELKQEIYALAEQSDDQIQ